LFAVQKEAYNGRNDLLCVILGRQSCHKKSVILQTITEHYIFESAEGQILNNRMVYNFISKFIQTEIGVLLLHNYFANMSQLNEIH
jgi:hypothetical protein